MGGRAAPEGRGESRLVVFDLDGTLLRTESITVPAVRIAFGQQGVAPPPDAEICSFIGRPMADLRAWLVSRFSVGVADEMLRVVEREERTVLETTKALYEGIEEMLAAVSDRIPDLAICSNGRPEYVEHVLESQGIAPLFAATRPRLPGDESKAGMLGDLLRWFGAPAAVVVGDRRDDIVAARANGAGSIGAAYGYGSAEELQEADATARSPSEIPRLLERLLPS